MRRGSLGDAMSALLMASASPKPVRLHDVRHHVVLRADPDHATDRHKGDAERGQRGEPPGMRLCDVAAVALVPFPPRGQVDGGMRVVGVEDRGLRGSHHA